METSGRTFTQLLRSVYDALHASRKTSLGRSVPPDTLIGELFEVARPTDIPQLLPLLSWSQPIFSREMRVALGRLAERASPADVPGIDLRIREALQCYDAPDSAKLLNESGASFGVLFIAACSSRGHVREAAIDRLSKHSDGSELAILLVRLGDWVPQVCDAAAAALRARLHDGYLTHWVRCLPVVERLRRQLRAGQHPLLRQIHELLASVAARPFLMAALAGPDRLTRRAAFDALQQSAGLFPDELVQAGLASDDTTIRLSAVRLARTKFHGDRLLEFMERFAIDRFAPIRREALYGFVEQFAEQAIWRLRILLFDRFPGIRASARFYLRQLSTETDFGRVYREAIRTSAPTSTIIMGLGETGSADDASLLLPFSSADSIPLKRAALQAIARLVPEQQDANPAISKIAREVLRSRRHLLRAESLAECVRYAVYPHVRRNAIVLANDLNWWQAAPLVLGALADADHAVRNRARAITEDWLRRPAKASRSPTRGEWHAIRHALDQYAEFLSTSVAEDLNHLLNYTRPVG